MSVHIKAICLAIAGLSLLCGSAAVQADDYTWTAMAGGTFSDPNCWAPAGVPSSADTAVFSADGTYVVTLGGSVANDRLLVDQGDVTLTFDDPNGIYTLLRVWDGETQTGSAHIGNVDGGAAMLTVIGGWVMSEETVIGSVTNSSGAMVVGSGAHWQAFQESDGWHGFLIGAQGAGQLTVCDGGQVSHGHGWAGMTPDATGTIWVTGAGSDYHVDGWFGLGAGGTGYLTVDDSAHARIGKCEMAIGDPGSVACANISGPGSRWDLDSPSEVSLVVGAVGTAQVTAENGGQITNAGQTCIAQEAGSCGCVTVSGRYDPDTPSTFDTGTYQITVGLSGTGALMVLDGGLVNSGYTLIGAKSGSDGMASVEGPGSMWNASGDLRIGGEEPPPVVAAGPSGAAAVVAGATGALSVFDGAEVNVAGKCFIGTQEVDSGSAQVSGAGSTWNINDAAGTSLTVGVDGYGAVVVENEGRLNNAGHLHVAEQAHSKGYLTIQSGGAVDVAGTLVAGLHGGSGSIEVLDPNSVLAVWGHGAGDPNDHVGLELGDDGGVGTMTIARGGHVSNNYITTVGGWGDGASGQLNVEDAGSLMDVKYRLEIGRDAPGTVYVSHGGRIDVSGTNPDPDLTGYGLVDVGMRAHGELYVHGADGSAISTLTSAGQIRIGVTAEGSMLVDYGGAVQSHKGNSATNTSAIIGMDPAGDGTVSLLGHSTWTNDGGLNVGWSGKGTMEIREGSVVQSQDGIVARLPGSQGQVIVSDPNSAWTNYNLSVGGTLTVAGGQGSLLVQNGGRVSTFNLKVYGGSSVALSDGHVLSNYMVLNGELSGTGSVSGLLDSEGGTISPGDSAGILTVNSLLLNSGSKLKIDVTGGSAIAGQDYDQLAIAGDVTGLGKGELIVKISPDLALLGDVLTILTTSSDLTGQSFGSVVFEGGLADVTYGDGTITLSRLAYMGDTNRDGVVDMDDLNDVFNHLGLVGQGIDGETNGDGVIDMDDLNNVFNNLGTVMPVGGGQEAPEPGSLCLLGAGFWALIARRRVTAKADA